MNTKQADKVRVIVMVEQKIASPHLKLRSLKADKTVNWEIPPAIGYTRFRPSTLWLPLGQSERYWINHFEVRPHYSCYEIANAWSMPWVKSLSNGESRDGISFPSRVSISHPSLNTMTRDPSASSRFQDIWNRWENPSKVPKFNFATNLLDFGEVDLVAFDENYVCI